MIPGNKLNEFFYSNSYQLISSLQPSLIFKFSHNWMFQQSAAKQVRHGMNFVDLRKKDLASLP